MAEEDVDFQLPDFESLRPADALRLYDKYDREAREANKAAKLAAQRKAKTKALALQVMEAYESDSFKTEVEPGKKALFSTYEFRAYRVVDEEAFKQWTAEQDEDFYDETPRLIESRLLEECRRRFDDGQELPPGVQEYTETRISKSAVK